MIVYCYIEALYVCADLRFGDQNMSLGISGPGLDLEVWGFRAAHYIHPTKHRSQKPSGFGEVSSAAKPHNPKPSTQGPRP